MIAYTLYNDAAYRHIRQHRLYKRGALDTFRSTAIAAGARQLEIPEFPADAAILKTVWWPVAKDAATPLPLWDPQANPPRAQGNGYTTWQRLVAVDASTTHAEESLNMEFAGRAFTGVRRVALDLFYHVTVDADLAERLMRDDEARRTALLALGRTMVEGDRLLLLGGNLATKELADWIWTAFWWHDHPDAGPFAADRPADQPFLVRQFLLQVAFDEVRPVGADGAPHVCFNPWLEGRFPDAGQGGGTASNCLACHRRASFPEVDFLPVTRGLPDLERDAAYAPERLRVGFMWSLPLHAGP